MPDDATIEVYKLSLANHNGPSLLIERDAKQLREALLAFWDELCPDYGQPPQVPEDGITLDILPTHVSGDEWRQASEFEWEGFLDA